MSRIPRELIKHLEWHAGQEVPVIEQPAPAPTPTSNTGKFSIDAILSGKTFFSDIKNSEGLYVGVSAALREATKYSGAEGIVVSTPELIAAKIKAEKTHDFWQKWYTVHTEENIDIDKKGSLVKKGKPVLLVVHGGGLLTPGRIDQAYTEGLINSSARYTEKEFDDLLIGKLPNGKSIRICTIDEIKKGVSNLPHQFGVVMSYRIAEATKSDYHNKKDFMENPLVIARAGGIENLEKYFEKAKNSSGNVGNWHVYAGRDPSQVQGRLLFLNLYNGLDGNYLLNSIGRFVGVAAPEAPVGAPRVGV